MTLKLTRRAMTLGLAALPLAPTAAQRIGRVSATVEADVLTLSNGLVRRVLKLPTPERPRLATIDYRPVGERSRFFTGAKEEWTWKRPSSASAWASGTMVPSPAGRSSG